MKIESLLRPKTFLFALCLGAAPVACNVDTDDDDDGGGGDDVDVDVEDEDEIASCQAECDDEDDACLDSCEVQLCGENC